MTDSTLRELERQFRSSGSVEDEAAWLRARVQAGELEQSKLELAAYCGYEAATVALRKESIVPEQPAGWVYRLHDISGKEPTALVAALAAEALLPIWETQFPHDSRPRAAIDVAWARLSCPCGDHDALGVEAANEAEAAANEALQIAPDAISPALRSLLLAEGRRPPGILLSWLALAARNASLPYTGLPSHVAASFAQASVYLDKSDLLRRTRDVLVPWALGYSDPVKERVEARRQEAAERE